MPARSNKVTREAVRCQGSPLSVWWAGRLYCMTSKLGSSSGGGADPTVTAEEEDWLKVEPRRFQKSSRRPCWARQSWCRQYQISSTQMQQKAERIVKIFIISYKLVVSLPVVMYD
jgi:hypothetical protein